MKAAERVVRVVSREQARLYMVGQLKLKSNVFSSGSDHPIFQILVHQPNSWSLVID
jgi:hypothetical protein